MYFRKTHISQCQRKHQTKSVTFPPQQRDGLKHMRTLLSEGLIYTVHVVTILYITLISRIDFHGVH